MRVSKTHHSLTQLTRVGEKKVSSESQESLKSERVSRESESLKRVSNIAEKEDHPTYYCAQKTEKK